MKFLIVLCIAVAVSAEPPRFRSARFRFQRQELAPSTTEAAAEPTTEGSGDGPYPPASGPYPPSGWRPSGQAFTLPARQSEPSDSYGAPAKQDASLSDSYGAPAKQDASPSDSYGAPAKQDASPSDSYGAPAKQDATPTDSYGAPAQSGPYPPSGWTPPGQAFTLPARQQAPSPPATSYGVPDTEYGAPSTAAPTDGPQAAAQAVEVQRSEGTYYVLLPNGQLQKVEFATENDPKSMAYSARLQYPVRNQAPLYVLNN